MATNTWKNTTTGTWSTGTLWSNGLPGLTDDVVLNQVGSNYIVTFDQASATIASLGISSANATLKFGASTAMTVTGGVTVSAGNLQNTNATSSLKAGSLTASGGTVTWSKGLIAIANAASVSAGSLNISSSLGTLTAGSLSVTGGSFSVTAGTVTVANLASFSNAAQSLSGVIKAGSIALSGSDVLTYSGSNASIKATGAGASSVSIGSGSAFNLSSSTGTLDASAGGISLAGSLGGIGVVSGPITGTGTISAGNATTTGTLDILGTVSKGVVLAIGSTKVSTLRLDGAVEAQNALSMTSTNQRLLIGSGGALTIDQAQTLSGYASAFGNSTANIQLAGGRLIDNSGFVLGTSGTNTGLIYGYGTIIGNFTNGAGTAALGGDIRADGGTLDIIGNVSSNIGIEIQDTTATTLKIDGTVVSTIGIGNASLSFLSSANQTLEIGATGALSFAVAETVVAAAIKLDGGSLTDTVGGGIVLGNATTAAGRVSGFGSILGTVTAGTSAGNIITASGGTLDMLATIASGVTLAIDTASASTLQISNTDSIANAISINHANQTLRIKNTGQLTIAQAETVSNGKISLAGGNLIDTSGIVLGAGAASGSIVGFGGIHGTITAAGSGTGNIIEAVGGTLLVTSGIGTGVTLEVDSGSTLKLSSTVGSGDIVTFLNNAGSTGTLFLANSGAITSFGSNGAIANMAVGIGGAVTDQIDFGGLTGVASTTITNGGTTVGLFSGAGGTGTKLASFNLTSALGAGVTAGFASDGAGGTDVFLVCFAGGTGIRTPDGDVAVEALQPGDMVAVLEHGTTTHKPVTWVGVRHLNLTKHARPELTAPVRIRAGALGDGLPSQDLLLSPDHCLFLDGKLVPAKLLINGMTIVHERATQAVSYYHVELENHGVLLAEGLPVESYLDTGTRAFFANAGLALMLHPEFHVNAGLRCWETDACAPLVVSQAVVGPIWEQIASRAEAFGYQRPVHVTTSDADIHLMVDGKAIYPMSVKAGRHAFMLPRNARSVRLMSRIDIPGDLNPGLDDWRRLGVRVAGMTMRGGDTWLDIPADHPVLRSGWHPVERHAASIWRWTNGDALLPIATDDEPAVLDIMIDETMEYRLDGMQTELHLAA